MKLKTTCLALAALLMSALSLSAAIVPLQDLIDRGELTLSFTATGGHTESCIAVKATHRGDRFVTTRIEPGRTLIASNPDEQNIVVTQELILALHPDQPIERQVFGFCYQSLNHGPSFGAAFSLGEMAPEMLLKVANYLNAHREIDPLTQQQAIWVVSDCHPLSSIQRYDEQSTDLAKLIAEGLGLKESWYTTQHAKTADHLFTPHVERIYASIPFEVNDYQDLTIAIYNEQGRAVKYLIRSTRYGPGSYTQPLDLIVARWPRGSYELAFENNDHQRIETHAFEL